MKIKLWIATDRDGYTFIYKAKPEFRFDGVWACIDDYTFVIAEGNKISMGAAQESLKEIEVEI